MKVTTIEHVDEGSIVTVQEEAGNRIVSNAFFFNSPSEALAFSASSFATAA